jgi:uncharacterized protein with PQ loop repeat
MKHLIAILCVIIALLLDSLSYYRQIRKTLKTKKSSQVSSTSFIYKILKAKFSITGLIIYANWVGVGMELVMLGVYIISLIVIMKYKPKGWSLWKN